MVLEPSAAVCHCIVSQIQRETFHVSFHIACAFLVGAATGEPAKALEGRYLGVYSWDVGFLSFLVFFSPLKPERFLELPGFSRRTVFTVFLCSSFPFVFSLADIYFVLNHEQNASEYICKILEFAKFCEH